MKLRELITKRIQYYMYTNGQYCFVEFESLGNLQASEIESLCNNVIDKIPEAVLVYIRVLRLVVDSGKGVTAYMTTTSGRGAGVFDLINEKFFDKIYICKDDSISDTHTACFRCKLK
jgi:hypothetical protein